MGIPVETPAANAAAFAALAASIGLVLQDGAGNGSQGNISLGIGQTSTITGNSNLRFGYKAGAALTSGIGNTLIGENAGKSITTGINNTAVGWDSQMFLVSGQNNTSLGEDALKYVMGNSNTGVGYTAGYSISSGSFNSAYAPLSLYAMTTGNYNSAYGHGSMKAAVTGDSNCVFGYDVAAALLSGTGNLLAGFQAFATATSGDNNTVLGRSAGYNASGSGNVFVGREAGYWENAGNVLMIDNQQRAGSVDARVKALLYGKFDAAVANQFLTVNGALNVNGPALLSGHLTFSTDAAYDIGNAALDKRPRNAYLSGSVTAGGNLIAGNNIQASSGGSFNWPSKASITSPANGVTKTTKSDGSLLTVAGLPAASTVGAGATSFVSDANATTYASVVAGGGSNAVKVYSDGTNWRIG